MIDRPDYHSQLSKAVDRSPITALLVPRQFGKTTLAKAFSQNRVSQYFDLESRPDLKRLENLEMMLG